MDIQPLRFHAEMSTIRVCMSRHKKAWEQSWKIEDERNLEMGDQKISVAEVDISPYRLPGFNSISEILASKRCPNNFRLMARIKDFYPRRLDACVILRCMKCQEMYAPASIQIGPPALTMLLQPPCQSERMRQMFRHGREPCKMLILFFLPFGRPRG